MTKKKAVDTNKIPQNQDNAPTNEKSMANMLGQEGVDYDPNISSEPFVIDFTNPICKVEGIRLNLGSGDDIKPNFLNVDISDPNADASWDARKLPLNDNSVAQIICYQTLEHIEMNDVSKVLSECWRVLKPKGNLVLVVPDMVSACQRYINDPEDDMALMRIYGNQSHEGQFHKSGYTPRKLYYLLGKAGFRFVRIAYYSESNGVRNIYADAEK